MKVKNKNLPDFLLPLTDKAIEVLSNQKQFQKCQKSYQNNFNDIILWKSFSRKALLHFKYGCKCRNFCACY